MSPWGNVIITWMTAERRLLDMCHVPPAPAALNWAAQLQITYSKWQHQQFAHLHLLKISNFNIGKGTVASTKRFVNVASANQNCCGDNSDCYNDTNCCNNDSCRRDSWIFSATILVSWGCINRIFCWGGKIISQWISAQNKIPLKLSDITTLNLMEKDRFDSNKHIFNFQQKWFSR